jgi:hypothetical protein
LEDVEVPLLFVEMEAVDAIVIAAERDLI